MHGATLHSKCSLLVPDGQLGCDINRPTFGSSQITDGARVPSHLAGSSRSQDKDTRLSDQRFYIVGKDLRYSEIQRLQRVISGKGK
ncbi:hypothetical protein BJV78DRAFT_1166771 [Lactifluus subvellereus]|nr:hypothetical protein BJV78DRAFT_1166771 [Lactifluus subvellereus]